MKVLIAFILAIGSAAAAGSGPYLPSGWKPDGPAFYLPSEIQKPSDNPLKETLFQETETSGSDALREYGPPKLDESPLQVSNQGLPDVITEQTFLIEAKSVQDVAVESIAVEEVSNIDANKEQNAEIVETITATESQEAISEDKASDASTSEAKLLEVQPTFEVSVLEVQPTLEASVLDVQPTFEASVLEVQPTFEASVLEVQPTYEASVLEVQPTLAANVLEVQPTLAANVLEVQPTLVANILEDQTTFEGRVLDIEQVAVENNTEAVSETTEKVEEFVPLVDEVVVDNVAPGVKNIADALEKLEKEIKVIEVETNQGATGLAVTQETSGSLEQAPEGFLEYGPPGFREYGPPTEEDLLRSALVRVASTDALDNNEVRRRRFSPKFRSPKKAH